MFARRWGREGGVSWTIVDETAGCPLARPMPAEGGEDLPRRRAVGDGMSLAAKPRPAPASDAIVDPPLSDGAEGDGLDRSLAGAQVIDRAIDILETFARIGPDLGVSEISRALGLKKATAHRLLSSLRRRGLVAQDPATRRYRLGLKLWELGALATLQVDWVQRIKPHLEQLTQITGETAHLAILSDGQILYVDKVESSHSLRMPSQVGRRNPVHCTGVGKAQVAWLPDDALAGLVSRRGLARFTAHTITEMPALRQELALIRERGYAVDNEEIEDGLVCIGAPIRDHTGLVVAGVSIAGPSSRLRPDTIPDHARSVVDVARAMSAVLGCPPAALGNGARPAS
jgi:DNA-binding IclR family transcriptional regulator